MLTYRRLDPADVTVHKGIPVTTVARTLVDLTDVFDAHELANVIHEAAYRKLFDLEETARRWNGERAAQAQAARRAIAIHLTGSTGTKSRAEAAFRKLVKPEEPLSNVIVEGVEVDFLFPERRMVVEIDDPSHGRKRSTARGRARTARPRGGGLHAPALHERARWRRGPCRC